ncbi:hypothetical protein H8B09_15465 [Paenibacillus sp. PR3]|uniref:Butirosin biosynthesis protein H N-terminal domain-containing protein n=1 Tax=Paenibacillus terricola TaxID=2763503 RepID=A0ABR8MW79_9BACL|nr:hypothetical protein [Paenibacillus terricola]MBD3920163.1 hypothetical protein [Paenibacillus terricola]
MSIILKHPASLEWIYSHYIQLELLQGLSGLDSVINYTFPDAPEAVCPWLDVQHIPRAAIDGNIVRWLQERLTEGHYVYLFLNTFHLPSYHTYSERHSAHDPLIVGYDNKARTFAIRDFHTSTQGLVKYETFDVDFTSLELSYHDISPDMDRLEGVQLLRLDSTCTFRLDTKLLTHSISDYLDAKCSYPKNHNWLTTPVLAYGSQLYTYIAEHLRSVAAESVEADFRFIHVLHDHKLLMSKRLSFMADRRLIPESLANSYNEVLTTSQLLRSTTLKYYLTQDLRHLQRSEQLLHDLQNKEQHALLSILDALQTT